MIHRAPFGSMERFVAVLIEHTAGKFPLWLTPDQVAILPISEKFNDYAQEVKDYLKRYIPAQRAFGFIQLAGFIQYLLHQEIGEVGSSNSIFTSPTFKKAVLTF